MKIMYLPKGIIVCWKVNKGRKKTNDYMTELFGFFYSHQPKS